MVIDYIKFGYIKLRPHSLNLVLINIHNITVGYSHLSRFVQTPVFFGLTFHSPGLRGAAAWHRVAGSELPGYEKTSWEAPLIPSFGDIGVIWLAVSGLSI